MLFPLHSSSGSNHVHRKTAVEQYTQTPSKRVPQAATASPTSSPAPSGSRSKRCNGVKLKLDVVANTTDEDAGNNSSCNHNLQTYQTTSLKNTTSILKTGSCGKKSGRRHTFRLRSSLRRPTLFAGNEGGSGSW